VEIPQVVGRFDRREVPFDLEQALQRHGIVRGVEQTAQPLLGRDFQGLIAAVQGGDGFVQFAAERGHLRVEVFDRVLADEPQSRLGIGQTQFLPVLHGAGPHRGDGLERRVPGVEQLLPRGHERALSAKCVGGLSPLFGSERFAHAEPTQRHAGCRHRGPESLRR